MKSGLDSFSKTIIIIFALGFGFSVAIHLLLWLLKEVK